MSECAVQICCQSGDFFDKALEGKRLAAAAGLEAEFCQLAKNLVSSWLAYERVVAAEGANGVDLVLQPSCLFLELLSALRAGDRDAFFRVAAAHGVSFQ